jgi:hypothetical protein
MWLWNDPERVPQRIQARRLGKDNPEIGTCGGDLQLKGPFKDSRTINTIPWTFSNVIERSPSAQYDLYDGCQISLCE